MPYKKINRSAKGYEDKRRRSAEDHRRRILGSQDIGALPDVVDPVRRFAASQDLKVFCETYLPKEFYLPWSPDHLVVIDTMQRCIEHGGKFVFAMPRGNGKSTMARAAALWATLTGRVPYVCLIGGSWPRASEMLMAMKTLILSPEMGDLRDDFPEALYPLWRLEDSPRRAAGQHINGAKTYCSWAKDRIVFPYVIGDTLPGCLQDLGMTESPSNCGIIAVASLDSHIRGQSHQRVDGKIARPAVILLDDPQTRDSAKSPIQTAFRLQLIRGDVMGLAGPDKEPAVFAAVTVMYENDVADQLLDPERNPQWQGRRMSLMYDFPSDEKLWDEYRKIRENSFRCGRRGIDATTFYQTNQVAMDKNAKVAWIHRKHKGEITAIQHAMNLRFDSGLEAFNSEYQNTPTAIQDMDEGFAKPVLVASRVNGRDRGHVPIECDKMTAFIDVHKQVLFWCVMGWKPDTTGFIVDYGTYPDQARHYYTLADAPVTLSREFKGVGEDGAIQSGLDALVTQLLEKSWPAVGGHRSLDRLLIDIGYKPSLVAAVKFKHKVSASIIWLSKGVGIKAGNKPINTYQRRPGWTIGNHWYVPNVAGTKEFPHVCVDVNYWKSTVHGAFIVTPGDPGSLTLFGNNPSDHSLFSQHIGGSETYVVTFGFGRQVCEWKLKPEKPDNHFLDCAVGCFTGAAMIGVFPEVGPHRERKKYTQSDLMKLRGQ